MRVRKQQGRVRECHGDLHLGNLAWVNGSLVIFDCIEFNPALRWIDVVSEVAFCYMDLLHRERRDLAFRFLNGWLEVSGDYQGIALLRYYAVYRAMVRAKVAALRARQSGAGASEVEQWLQLAEQLTRTPPLRLWITHGLAGCGKTTLSQTMLQEQGLVRLRSDIERKRLAGLPPPRPAAAASPPACILRMPAAALRSLGDAGRRAAGGRLAGDRRRRLPSALAARPVPRARPAARPALPYPGHPGRPCHLRERIVRRAALGQDASEADLRVLDHQIATAEPLGQMNWKLSPHRPSRLAKRRSHS